MVNEQEKSQQELVMQFQMFEQQIRMLQEQSQAIEQAIVELGSLSFEIEELVGKKDEEILSPIGRGIYVNAKLVSEELLVDIGNKNFVKKSVPETKIILKNQIKKLEKAKQELNKELEKINTEITQVFMEHQKSHEHNHDCNCGEECECDEEECGGCGEECECHK